MAHRQSVFRQPGARHFQLVHRSQRDPLIHDQDVSQHVLKPVVRGNARKGKTRADLEAILAPDVIAHDVHANVGEAALYGIYFDDTAYNYMQHLRAVGTKGDGIESILIEAPHPQNRPRPKREKSGSDCPPWFHDLPAEALPSKTEMPRNFETQEAVPTSIAGFRPDMDPHLRQTLDALEDDAFVDGDLEDSFFAELVHDGERDEQEVDYEFHEYGPPEAVNSEEDDESWEARFAKFKKGQKNAPSPLDSDEDTRSEGRDTVGNLPKLSVIGGKRRRKGTSDASGYSMSSSSVYRTEALLTLDERFDQLMAKEYESDESALDNDRLETASTSSSLSSSSAPDLITSRKDYGGILDEFNDKYELLGQKLKPVLAGKSGVDKLETLRRALGQDGRLRVTTTMADKEEELDDEALFRAYATDEKEDRWDCETILTTYSNLENHPHVIRARSSRPVPKIKLDSRTGLPRLANDGRGQKLDGLEEGERAKRGMQVGGSESLDGARALQVVNQTPSRPRDEPREDKRARKQAVKAERQTRCADKKTTKERFDSEMKRQARQSASSSGRVRRL